MKSVILPLILFIGVSCETDIDIIPDHTKTVPIIYSIIDPYDTIQTVRIERSFIVRDKEGAKLDNPDSLYFDSVNVQGKKLKKIRETLPASIITYTNTRDLCRLLWRGKPPLVRDIRILIMLS